MARATKKLSSRLTWAVIAAGLVLLIGLSPTVLAQSQSSDATLSALTLSDVDIGTFASSTTTYTASVANRVTETTVTPTVNQPGASYVVELDGVEDADGEASLSVGSNVITVEVTAEDGSTTQTYTVTVTRAENTPATGKPVITGTAEVGETLTVDVSSIADEDGIAGGFGGAAWTFQWSDSCNQVFGAYYIYDDSNPGLYAALGGEKQKSWEIPWNAAGAAVQVKVTFYDEGGDTERLFSDFTPVVPGPLESLTLVDVSDSSDLATLDCDDDQEIVLDAEGRYTVRADLADGADVGSISWNWDHRAFTGTDNTAPYVLFGEDEYGNLVGRQMSASADRYGGHDIEGRVYSRSTDEVQLIRASFFVTHDTPATGAPTISGTAQVGETLTASTSGISDADGLTNVTYTYQWLADDTEISDATSSTYMVQSSNNGKIIKVRVDFRDDAGTRESLTSAGTAAVVLGGL